MYLSLNSSSTVRHLQHDQSIFGLWDDTLSLLTLKEPRELALANTKSRNQGLQTLELADPINIADAAFDFSELEDDKNLLFKTSLKIHAITMKCQDFSIRMEGI
jgi:hypothetical protein